MVIITKLYAYLSVTMTPGQAMDVRQLRYFVAIVEQGSITRAAAVLNVAQPALSLHLKNMEEQLQTKLLVRGRTGVKPTEAGTLLFQRAGSILDDFARTEDDIRNLESDPSGVVRIGLPGTISAIIALPLIKAARYRYPRIKITVAEAMSGFIADWISDRRVDIAVLYNSFEEQGLISEQMLEEELVVLWSGASPGPKKLKLSDLHGVPMVLPSSQHGLRIQLDTAMTAAGIQPNVVHEIDSYTNIKHLVAAKFGTSILPLHAVHSEIRAGALSVSRIITPDLLRSVHLVYPALRQETRAQSAVRDLMRQVVLDLVQKGEWTGARATPPLEIDRETHFAADRPQWTVPNRALTPYAD